VVLAACSSQRPGDLGAGSYLAPLVQLQRLQGGNDHLHVDEVRLREDGMLLQCSYTFGVVDAREPGAMRYLAEGLRHEIPDDRRRPGCIHLAADGDDVYTTHRGNIRNPSFLSGWNISDARNPVQLPVLQEQGVSYEGIDVANGYLFVGLHGRGLGVYRRTGVGGFERVGTATGLHNAWGVSARSDTVFVADGGGGLAIVDASNPANPVVRSSVATGGSATDVVVDNDIAYVAAGSAGLVVVDVADLDAPRVIGGAPTPGSAVRVDYSEGHAFVAAWTDARVYDVVVPGTPRLVGAVRLTREGSVEDPDRPALTSRILGIAARGNVVFVGNWHVLHSFRLFPERAAPWLRLAEESLLVDFGQVAAGETARRDLPITNEGTVPLAVLNAWVAGDAFEVEPARLSIPPGETATLSLTFRPAALARKEEGYLQILSDDPMTPRRAAYLVGNQPGLSVGMELPETRATLLDGTEWSSTETRGTVTVLAFFATF
jgi:hypothetical protein